MFKFSVLSRKLSKIVMSLTQNLNLHDSLLWLDQAADTRCGVAAATVCSLRRYDAVLSSVVHRYRIVTLTHLAAILGSD